MLERTTARGTSIGFVLAPERLVAHVKCRGMLDQLNATRTASPCFWDSSTLPRLPVPMKIQLEYALLIRSRTPALGSVSHSGMAHRFRPDTWDRFAISGPWGIVLLDEGQ